MVCLKPTGVNKLELKQSRIKPVRNIDYITVGIGTRNETKGLQLTITSPCPV